MGCGGWWGRALPESQLLNDWMGCTKSTPARARSNCARALNQDRIMTQFDLTDDQREIQNLARRFTADAITPHAAE
jgi:hypothetical protein